MKDDCPDCAYWQNKYIQADAEKRELEIKIGNLLKELGRCKDENVSSN